MEQLPKQGYITMYFHTNSERRLYNNIYIIHFIGDWGKWKGIEQQLMRARTLKYIWDKSVEESVLVERKLNNNDR